MHDHLLAQHVQVNVTKAETAQCINQNTVCPSSQPADQKGSCPSGNTLEAGEAAGGLSGVCPDGCVMESFLVL